MGGLHSRVAAMKPVISSENRIKRLLSRSIGPGQWISGRMSFLRTSARLYQMFHQRLVTCVGYKQLIEMVTKSSAFCQHSRAGPAIVAVINQ